MTAAPRLPQRCDSVIHIVERRTFLTLAAAAPLLGAAARRTEISIRGEQFVINGKPTYPGRTYRGLKIKAC